MSEPNSNEPARVPTRRSSRWVQWVLERLAGQAVADAFIGDLHECYHAMVTRYGARRAQWWVWWQLLRAVLALGRIRAPSAHQGRHPQSSAARRMQLVRRYGAVGLLVLLATVAVPWWRQGGPSATPPPVPPVSATAAGDPHTTRALVNPDPRMVRILPNPDPRMVRVRPNPERPPDAALATLP